MHCYICDREDDLINFDRVAGGYSTCTTCQEAINECLEAFDEEEDTAISPEWELHEIVEFGAEPYAYVQQAIPSGP